MPLRRLIIAGLTTSLIAVVGLPIALLLTLTIAITAATAVEEAADQGPEPSAFAETDIPDGLVEIYRTAATECDGLDWTILAGIAKVESDHGRIFGGTSDAAGTIRPPIRGIALDGRPGIARIRDTDNGRLDGDTTWDRAVGPFQFIPTSWAIYGADTNGDDRADPNNLHDASAAAARHLCPTGTLTNIPRAIRRYNNSSAYVRKVLEVAETLH